MPPYASLVIPRHRVFPSSPMTGDDGKCAEAFSTSLRANGSRECAPDDRLKRSNPETAATKRLDCFVALLLAMTALSFKRDSAISRRDAPEVCMNGSHPEIKEGAGKAGCALHPRSRVQICAKKRTRAYRSSGGNPAFTAQWFYGLLRALPGDRALLPPSPADIATRQLDASVGASGPHGFAVRNKRFRPACMRAPDAVASTASHPNVRDDHDTPLLRGGTVRLNL